MDVAAEDNPFSMGGQPDEEDPEVEDEVLETPTDVRGLVGTLFELIVAGFVPEPPGPLDWKQFKNIGLSTEAGPQLDGATDVRLARRTSPVSGVPRWNHCMVGYLQMERPSRRMMRRSPEPIVAGPELLTN
jgi:hypothetical protein